MRAYERVGVPTGRIFVVRDRDREKKKGRERWERREGKKERRIRRGKAWMN
jgi:hypothetical protein